MVVCAVKTRTSCQPNMMHMAIHTADAITNEKITAPRGTMPGNELDVIWDKKSHGRIRDRIRMRARFGLRA